MKRGDKKMEDLIYPYNNGEFKGILHQDCELQILYNNTHLCYIDLDNYEEFGNVSLNELFKIVIEDLIDDNFSNLIEELYFQRKEL